MRPTWVSVDHAIQALIDAQGIATPQKYTHADQFGMAPINSPLHYSLAPIMLHVYTSLWPTDGDVCGSLPAQNQPI
jgi:hypothetical protein